jgi:Rrf2 family protein
VSSILRITEGASIAIHAMYLMACEEDKLFSTREIASILHVSENHLAKILQRLVKDNLIASIRGPKGGFKLNKLPDQIKLIDIYESIDGILKPSNCLLGQQICNGNCILGELISSINNQVVECFSNKLLADFVSK